MKQLIVKSSLLVMLFLGIAQLSVAQLSQAQRVYVNVQPQEKARPRPMAPKRNYVWIGGEYIRRGAHYVYRPGYWTKPHHGFTWMQGHWIQTHRGWYWSPGYWARRR